MTSPVPATADPLDESRATASAADGAILMVCFTFPPEFGGAIVQALRLGAELQTRGCEVAFLADNGDAPMPTCGTSPSTSIGAAPSPRRAPTCAS
ncbi:glycosyltransferase family 4 protein [Mitsuaria sp. TWR114]|uniref:glycosyltransferase family 4 protein n=1 Tax=Mitsuaria sp. TWR114 TaxID=2601731 RepID=UPI0011BEFF32|nr:glycosyltransferase family 4 protein [Mitsuaria sp. TWR114]TXD97322.1 glycosyltransferase family 4 protein [Mitsuaria sp. TWR114]